MNAWLRLFLTALVAIFASIGALAQTWTPIASTGGPTLAGANLLLTDGSVIVQQRGTSLWYKLTPTNTGDYVHGVWTPIASLPAGYGPLYFASAVLADGRAIIIGGEYNNLSAVWTNRGAIYDPILNTWTEVAPPPGWAQIGDAQCTVLPNKHFLVAHPFDTQMADLNPDTMTWTAVGSGKTDRFDEEGWTLLPDGNILTVDAINNPACEKYIVNQGVWISAGSTPQSLAAIPSQEIGPAILMYDGRVFCTGGTGHNAIYTPGANSTDPGTWISAPDFPIIAGQQLDIADGPACLLTNGKVLTGASPGVFLAGTRFFEFDGTNLTQVASTQNALSNPSYVGNMLMLPNGQVMYTDFSSRVEIYTSVGAPQEAWKPTITNCPTLLSADTSYVISGTQFNGLSECCHYGDDASNATNYPLVRLTNLGTGHVRYLRTFNHSQMGVATGSLVVSTNFAVPTDVETGASTLEVVTNGIASAAIGVNVGAATTNPILQSIAPNTKVEGDPEFNMTLNGIQFQVGDVAMWTFAGKTYALKTGFVSANQLSAFVPAKLIFNAGTASVQVVRGIRKKSNALPFVITPDNPTLTTIAPNSVQAFGPDITITLTGTRFRTDDVVMWTNGATTTELVKTYNSPTSMTAVVPAALTLDQGSATVKVVNYRNHPSNTVTFTILPDNPVLQSMTPNSAQAFGPDVTITLTGSRFRSDDTVNWTNGATTTPLAMTYLSQFSMTAVVPAALIANQGSATVTVVNIRNHASNGLTFTITPDNPIISSISPSSTPACGPDFTLTVNGSRFVNGDVVHWNGFFGDSALVTTFVSATQLTAVVPAAITANSGTATVTVVDPRNQPSNGAGFLLTNPIPVLTSVTPNSVTFGAPATTVTLTGSCFVSPSVARFKIGGNRVAIPTTYVNDTTLTAVIPASMLVSPGSATLDVDTPAPGGGASLEVAFTVGGSPTLTAISPSSVAVGQTFAITLTGAGFDVDANILINGTEIATTFVSSTTLTGTVPGTLVPSAGIIPVWAENGGLGGASNTRNLTVNNPAPNIASLSPASAVHGSPAVALTVNGTGFVPTSVVRLGNTNMSTTFISSTQLSVTIPASMMVNAGNIQVRVNNPAPGGGNSNQVNFVVQ